MDMASGRPVASESVAFRHLPLVMPDGKRGKASRTRHRLIAQWGVRHGPGSPKPLVVFPFSAQWTAHDTCLVVDRCLPRNRIIEFDRQARIEWVFEAEPRMNFAHRLACGTVIFTRGNGLFAVDRAGRPEEVARLEDDAVPNCGSVLGDVVVLGSDAGLDWFSLDGRHLSRLRPSESTFIEPVGVHLLPSGTVLVADGEAACVVEVTPRGERIATFGRWRQPGLRDGKLSVPLAACRLGDGSTIVADWRSHRIARFDSAARELPPLPVEPPGGLFAPAHVSVAGCGDVVIAETGSRRISRWSPQGEMQWVSAREIGPERTLSFPRSAIPLTGGELLVCDSYQDRVVVLGPLGDVRWVAGNGADAEPDCGLSIPRSATRSADGRTSIADGLNGRVVVVDSNSRVTREVTSARIGRRRMALGDPHHAELTLTGELLVVDAELNEVLLLGPDDTVVARWGRRSGRANPGCALSDPHQARLLADGGILVADSGHNRVAEFDRAGRLRWQAGAVVASVTAAEQALRCPRFADALPNGDLLIVDTDASRILRIARSRRVAWQVGPLLDEVADEAASPELRVPKWAALDARGRLLVTDYYNCRVALVEIMPSIRRRPGELAARDFARPRQARAASRTQAGLRRAGRQHTRCASGTTTDSRTAAGRGWSRCPATAPGGVRRCLASGPSWFFLPPQPALLPSTHRKAAHRRTRAVWS